MGFLDRLRRGVSGSDDEDANGVKVCEACGYEFEPDDMDDSLCEDCRREFPYSGPKYCCGAIYEHGEEVCRSCGEPL